MRANRLILIFVMIAGSLFQEAARPVTLSALPPEPLAWAGLVKAMEQNPESGQTREDIRTYISNYPESENRATAIHMLAEVSFRRQEFRAALAAYEECLARYPKTNFRESTLYRISECHMNLGEQEAARKIRTQMLEEFPNTRLKPEIAVDQALGFLKDADLKAAAQAYADCAKMFPWYRKNRRLLEGQSWIAFQEQRYAEVANLIRPTEVMSPLMFSLKSRSLLAMGDGPGAASWLLHTPPEYRDQALGLLYGLVEKGHYEAAVVAWQKLAAQAGYAKDPEGQFLMGYAWMRLGRFGEAKKVLTDYLKNPRATEKVYAWFFVGIADVFLRDTEAASVWPKLIDGDSADGGVDVMLDRAGSVAYQQENYAQTILLSKNLVERFPQSPWTAGAYLRLSQACYKAGDDRSAMNAYKEYVRRGGADSKAHDYWEAVQPALIRLQARLRQASQAVEKRATFSASTLAGSPWLSMIAQSPVLVVHPQKTGLRFAAWHFTVSDLAGTVWYKAAGGSTLPDRFTWEGRLPNGRMVGLGQKFMVNMNLTDASGKTLYTTSHLSQLNNLVYRDSKEFRIELSAPMVFVNGRHGEVSMVGQSLLREAGDLILDNMDGKIWIEVTGDRIQETDLKARCVKDALVRNLGLAPEDVQVQARASAPGLPDKVAIVAPGGGRTP